MQKFMICVQKCLICMQKFMICMQKCIICMQGHLLGPTATRAFRHPHKYT